MTDGTLRLLSGVISTGVLLLLLDCGVLPSLKIDTADFQRRQPDLADGADRWFRRGFLERWSRISWRRRIPKALVHRTRRDPRPLLKQPPKPFESSLPSQNIDNANAAYPSIVCADYSVVVKVTGGDQL